MAKRKILIVEDRQATRTMLQETLADEGYAPVAVGDGESAIEKLRGESFDLVLTDLALPGKDGFAVLGASLESDPLAPVIVMTAYGTVENAVEAMKRGAYDFVTKPVDTDRLLLLVRRAWERRTLQVANRSLSAGAARPVIIGRSAAIRKVFGLARKVAPRDTAVLLQGESGTGKELFARTIHSLSGRAKGPLITVNCAAIPRELVETELFGAERGAFTGADRRRIGKFELADGGTLFFDEIGELPLDLQSKLLRALEERTFERVGGCKSIRVDVRLVTATNRPLEREAERGRFRRDLLFRLDVFPIHLPALRERAEDIPLLSEHFLSHFCREMRREPIALSREALQAMVEYEWPGNVRELRNVLERAVILTDGRTIPPELVAPRRTVSSPEGGEGALEGGPAPDLRSAVRSATRRVEAGMIGKVLRECGGNKSEAARRMNISYRSLWSKVKEYGLEERK